MRGNPWTDTQTRELLRLLSDGMPLDQIVAATGRSRKSIYSKMMGLGLRGALACGANESPRIDNDDPLLARLRRYHS